MHNSFNHTILTLLSLFILSSCEKVIQIDLNSSDPQIVIEGAVTNAVAPYQVKISRSVNFDQSNQYPAVSDALVIIHSDAGERDTLLETVPGLYVSTRVAQGQPGTTYTLEVFADGQRFEASSTMPAVVPFLGLSAVKFTFGGPDAYAVVPSFVDPETEQNYYQFIQFNNGRQLEQIFVLDDKNNNGIAVQIPLLGDTEIALGDTVTIEMRSIDAPSYQYLFALQSATGDVGNASAPANPDNNWKGTALGFFSAHTVQRKTVVVQ